jgi:hypothetical protein
VERLTVPAMTPSAGFLTHTCTVTRYPSAQAGTAMPQDDAAGRDEARADVPGLVGLPCSIQPESGRPGLNYDGRVLEVDTCVYFGRAVDVRADDVLAGSTGKLYLVQAAGDEAEQDRVSWVLCKRLG